MVEKHPGRGARALQVMPGVRRTERVLAERSDLQEREQRGTMGRVRYQSGEDVRDHDQIRYHGESGHVEFVATEKDGEHDWYVDEFPGGGVMIWAKTFGSVFIESAEVEADEDLEFVSRAEAATH